MTAEIWLDDKKKKIQLQMTRPNFSWIFPRLLVLEKQVFQLNTTAVNDHTPQSFAIVLRTLYWACLSSLVFEPSWPTGALLCGELRVYIASCPKSLGLPLASPQSWQISLYIMGGSWKYLELIGGHNVYKLEHVFNHYWSLQYIFNSLRITLSLWRSRSSLQNQILHFLHILQIRRA